MKRTRELSDLSVIDETVDIVMVKFAVSRRQEEVAANQRAKKTWEDEMASFYCLS